LSQGRGSRKTSFDALRLKNYFISMRVTRKNLILFFLFFLVLMPSFSQQAFATKGIGVIVGNPTGLSFRVNRFPVLAVAWSGDSYIHLNMDYWLFNPRLEWPIKAYVGVGGNFRFGDNFGIGVRFPLGLQLFFARRFELFGELVPGVQFIDNSGFDLDAGIGLRFLF
jgi:hypothetical protein